MVKRATAADDSAPSKKAKQAQVLDELMQQKVFAAVALGCSLKIAADKRLRSASDEPDDATAAVERGTAETTSAAQTNAERTTAAKPVPL